MAEAKTTEQRALAHISNKIDECYVKIEHLEAMLKARLAPPPGPKADAVFDESKTAAAA